MPEVSRFFGIVVRMYYDWTALHQQELMRNWEELRKDHPVAKIKPLE